MMRIRDKILQKMKKQQTPDNLQLYKKFRNRVSNELKESKERYFHNYFYANSQNMKKLIYQMLLRNLLFTPLLMIQTSTMNPKICLI